MSGWSQESGKGKGINVNEVKKMKVDCVGISSKEWKSGNKAKRESEMKRNGK